MSDFRIGSGEDIHLLAKGRKLIIGGVEIPFEFGLLGHSDADVVYHALADSLLGSLALGDIGGYFPPDDPSCLGIASSLIVQKALSLVMEKGYRVGNVDISIFAEKPRLAIYISSMRKNIAVLLGIETAAVSVKAMTNEGCDAVGEGKAIRAVSTVLVTRE